MSRRLSLRLAAYRHSLQPSEERRPEHFSCVNKCVRGVGLKLDREQQAFLRCALPGFDTGTWPTDEPSEENRSRFKKDIVPVSRLWLGAPRDYSRKGQGDWAWPAHQTDEAGCPGAWYRTPWFESLAKFYRRPTENRGRIDNPNLTQCDDPLIQEAIAALEAFEDAAHAEHMSLVYAQQKSKQKAGH